MKYFIEVFYFIKGRYEKRSFKEFSEEAAILMYYKTIEKFKENKEQVIVSQYSLEKGVYETQKSERLNFDDIRNI